MGKEIFFITKQKLIDDILTSLNEQIENAGE